MTCQNTFVERLAWREPERDYSLRYEQHICQRARKEPLTQIAKDEGLSEEAVQGIFERWAKKRSPSRGWPIVKVLYVDEIAQHKGHGSYRLVIYAPELGIVLDVLQERTKEAFAAWLDRRGAEWCAQVKVLCADMWDAYHEAAADKLPHAQRVVDRFHGMMNLNDALSKARRSIQNQAEEATKALLKGSRWWLVKNRESH